MPYINKESRDSLEHVVKAMHISGISNAGELNYLLTQLVHTFLSQHPKGYQNFNDAVGALEGAKLELYRQHISNYENEKIKLNGDVP